MNKMKNETDFFREEKNRDNPYAQISKKCLNDVRLSWKARGLLSYLLGLPDNWAINKSHLVKMAPDGMDSLVTGCKELESFGYMESSQLRNKLGQIVGYRTVIREKPILSSDCSKIVDNKGVDPERDNPVMDKSGDTSKEDTGKHQAVGIKRSYPERDFPDQDNPQLINNNLNNISSSSFDNKEMDREETPSRSSLSEEGNLKNKIKVEDCSSQEGITSKVSDERAKTMMSYEEKPKLGKFRTLDRVPQVWLDYAAKRFNIKRNRVAAVEGAFLEFYIRNENPRSLVTWEKLWTEFVKRRVVMKPGDFEALKIAKKCTTHKYKKRTGIDAKICDIMMGIVGPAYFYSYFEQGSFEEVEPNKLKFFAATKMAYDWFEEQAHQSLKKLGYKVIAHEITGLKSS